MAVRIDATDDFLYATANLPSGTQFSILGWFYFTTDLNAAGILFEIVNAAFTQYCIAGLHSDGTTLRVSTQVGTTTGTALTTGNWYHIAYTRDGATHTLYLNGVSDISRSDNNTLTTPAYLFLGSNNSAPVNGRLANILIYSGVALTQAEVLQQMYQYIPARTTSLNRWCPMFPGATERTLDYFNGYTLSVSGTLTDEAGPPVTWGIFMPALPVFVAAGGTTYNQSISGEITPAGVLLLQGQKILTGGITPGATLIKEAQKLLSGTIAPNGDILKQTDKILSGVITPSGALTTLRTAYMVLTGAITPTGDLVRQTQKVLTGTITPVGVLINQAQKILDGSITTSGTLTTIKTFLVSLGGSITPSGNLLNETQKILIGSITPIGDLLKQTQKVLDGGITPSGVLTAIKTVLIDLVGSIAPSGSLITQTQKVLTGSIVPSGIIVKLVGKLLDGIITPASILVGVIVGAGTTAQIAFKGMFRGMFRRM